MSIITLTTDYGLRDHFVGAMKGKILSEFPDCRIIDISHDIDPFNISEASYVIGAAWSAFPKGTVHIIGVDSELTSENRHIAMLWNDQYFICADNGILSMLTSRILPEKIVAINIHDRLPEGSADMDVFIKVACHLSRGGLLNVIGKEIASLKQVTELKPVVASDNSSIKGYVIYIDHFGNAVVNIDRKLFHETAKGRDFEILMSKKNIKTIHERYSDIVTSDRYGLKYYEGTKLAIFNEAGYLEIAIFRSNPKSVGSASTLLGLGYRDEVRIKFINPK